MVEELTQQEYKARLDAAIREAAEHMHVPTPADVHIINDARIRGEYHHDSKSYDFSKAAIRELPHEELVALVGHELQHEQHTDALQTAVGPLMLARKASVVGAMASVWGPITSAVTAVAEQVGLMDSHVSFAQTLLATTALAGAAIGSHLAAQATLRHYEYDADRGAVEVTSPEITARMLRHKAEYNAPFEESKAELLDDHPTLEHRVVAALRQKEAKGDLPEEGFSPGELSPSGLPSFPGRNFSGGPRMA